MRWMPGMGKTFSAQSFFRPVVVAKGLFEKQESSFFKTVAADVSPRWFPGYLRGHEPGSIVWPCIASSHRSCAPLLLGRVILGVYFFVSDSERSHWNKSGSTAGWSQEPPAKVIRRRPPGRSQRARRTLRASRIFWPTAANWRRILSGIFGPMRRARKRSGQLTRPARPWRTVPSLKPRSFSIRSSGAPAFAEGWNRRATLHWQLKSYEASLRLQKVLALNPQHFSLAKHGLVPVVSGDLAGACAAACRAGNHPHDAALRQFLQSAKNCGGASRPMPRLSMKWCDRSMAAAPEFYDYCCSKEIKEQELRVALLPSAAYQLIKRGHHVLVERALPVRLPTRITAGLEPRC